MFHKKSGSFWHRAYKPGDIYSMLHREADYAAGIQLKCFLPYDSKRLTDRPEKLGKDR